MVSRSIRVGPPVGSARAWLLLAVLALPIGVGLLVSSSGSEGTLGVLQAITVAGATTVGAAYLLQRSGAAAPSSLSGLATYVDSMRSGDALSRPVAAIVVELRGIAAYTVVDGADAWTEPLTLITRRLLDAELGASARIARLSPHGFGAIVNVPRREDAVAVAEQLVALCRLPIATPVREIRVDAVAGVCHAEAGDDICGEELLRTADASMRVDGPGAAPVSTAGGPLARHARRVVEVETEIRHSLDVDLLTARLMPVVHVRDDSVVGLRSGYDWTAVSRTEPEILRSVAGSLGLRRSLETQYLMRSISAAEVLPGASSRPIVASIGADRLTDDRAVAQLGLLIRASGAEPGNLVLELDGWGAGNLSRTAHGRLSALGVGVGLRLRHHGDWEHLPPHIDEFDSISVSALELLDGDEIAADRVDRLARLVRSCLDLVTVLDVDSAPLALELSAAGLPVQCGQVHGRPLTVHDLSSWMTSRQG